MHHHEEKGTTKGHDEPATIPGPTSGEEELKDYSKVGENDLTENMPDSHPEPSPAGNSWRLKVF
jgi:hypothetical protein